jgi:hypothetical protein
MKQLKAPNLKIIEVRCYFYAKNERIDRNMSKSIYCVGKINGGQKEMIVAENNTTPAKRIKILSQVKHCSLKEKGIL